MKRGESKAKRLRVLIALAAAAVLALTAIPASASAGTKSHTTSLSGNNSAAVLRAKCPGGQRASGGGFFFSKPPGSIPVIYESRKIGQKTWQVLVQLSGSGPISATAYAYCSADAPKTKAKSTTIGLVPPVALQFADARCGSSGKAMSGGFAGPLPDASGADLFESFRLDKKTWRTTAGASGTPSNLTSYVYCADEKKPATRIGSTSASTVATPRTALSAECKRGTKPAAGGFSTPDANLTGPSTGVFNFVNESRRVGKRWQVSANHAGMDFTTLNSLAYCA